MVARLTSERGQGSVEFVAAVPLALLAAAVAWQLALAGHTAWMAGHAARAGARAEVVGRDPARAARSALPEGLERGLEVEREDGVVRVRVPVPILLHRWRSDTTVGATASLGEAGR